MTKPLLDSTVSAADVQAAFDFYNQLARQEGWCIALKLDPRRAADIRVKLREDGGLDGWKAIFSRAIGNDFLAGRVSPGFRASLDFFIQPSRQVQWAKLMEGGWDGPPRPRTLLDQQPDGTLRSTTAGSAHAPGTAGRRPSPSEALYASFARAADRGVRH